MARRGFRRPGRDRDREGTAVGMVCASAARRSLRRGVSDTESQLAARRAELDRLQRGITANAVAAGSDKTAKEERVDAVLDAAKLAERVGQVKAQIRTLEGDLVLRRQELDTYLANNPAPY